MSDEISREQEVAALNRRKPENRWRRILRDADWDQHESVRRWLKLARKFFEQDDEDSTPRPALDSSPQSTQDSTPAQEKDRDKKRAA